VAVTIWGGAEGATTIIAASIPILRALFRGDKGRSTARFDTIDDNRLNHTSLDTLTSPRKADRDTDLYIHGA
jgi:hypothetical protein